MKHLKHFLHFVLIAAVLGVSCTQNAKVNKAGIDPKAFDKMVDGKKVALYTLVNKNGLEMNVTNYGAKVVSLLTPDKNGVFEDIVLGFDNLDQYLNIMPYFGAAIGRYGNRIANGKFSLNGQTYQLNINNAEHCHHGGAKGFHSVVWDANVIDGQTIAFSYLSKDMEEGFPGNLTVKMVYTLNDNNEFKITYQATTDKATVVNLTHHSFFNLLGAGNASINSHILYINADYFTPTDKGSIPTGEIIPVAGTPMDFTTPVEIGLRIDDNYEPLVFSRGYDHNYVLKGTVTKSMVLAASLYEPTKGRFVEVETDAPAIQFYSSNYLNGSVIGKGSKPYKHRSAVCLESQHYPDSPNKPQFPSTVLNPGEVYTHTCIYRFSVK